MEYMMTYGWAILAVMVVGVAMWHLGVLDMAGSTPATSSGFDALKPLLATCKISSRNPVMDFGGGNAYYGFGCEFVNGAGSMVNLIDANLSINGQMCDYMDVQISEAAPQRYYMNKMCWNTPAPHCSFPPGVWDSRPGGVSCTVDGTMRCAYRIPSDGVFLVSFDSRLTGGGPCPNIVVGEKYEIQVVLTYLADVGGVVATKMSSGTVHVVGT
jgi:hypothetical protein